MQVLGSAEGNAAPPPPPRAELLAFVDDVADLAADLYMRDALNPKKET